MSKSIELAFILTAYDRATQVVNDTVNRMETRMRKFQGDMIKGAAMIGGAKIGSEILGTPIKAFASFEKAALSTKASLMKSGGLLDEAQWVKVEKLSQRLGVDLPGNAEDMLRMMDILKRNGVETEHILGGIAEATAKLSAVNNLSKDETALHFANIHNAIGIAGKDMVVFADIMNRAMRTGAGTDLQNMKDAFAKAGPMLKAMGMGGVEASKSISGLFTMFIKGGSTGQVVGTNFARIWKEALNPEKYAAFQRLAKLASGETIELLDKQGNFAGIENMLSQFDKLKGLNTQAMSAVLKPLTGAEGFDDTFIQALIKFGSSDFNKQMDAMFNKTATLDAMKKMMEGGVDWQWERAMGNVTNSMIELGKTLKPVMIPLINFISAAANGLQAFTEKHPGLVRILLVAIGIGSAMLFIGGALKIMAALWSFAGMTAGLRSVNFLLFAMRFHLVTSIIPWLRTVGVMAVTQFTRIAGVITAQVIPAILRMGAALLMNPWTWVAVAAVAAVVLIIKNWDRIKLAFLDLGKWVMGLGTRFYNAGANIMNSLWRGIKAGAMLPINLIKDIASKIMDFWPQSPAKTGPLRNIHKIRIMETIADTVNPRPMLKAMNRNAGLTLNAINPHAGGGGGAQIHIAYNPVITGVGSVAEAKSLLKEHADELLRLVEDKLARRRVVNY